MRGRPPKHFYPLLQQEKELTAAVPIFCDGTFLRNWCAEVVHQDGRYILFLNLKCIILVRRYNF